MAKKYYRDTFVEAVKIITPDVYLEQDLDASGLQVTDVDQLIKSHLFSADNIANTLNPSSIAKDHSFSALGTINGLAQFFVKQNKLTTVTTKTFENKILRPLGKSIADFATKHDFSVYVSATLLPKIALSSTELYDNTSGTYSSGLGSGTYNYLANNLGWLFLLNTGATVNAPYFAPSSLVVSAITEKLYYGKDYLINDGVKDYQEYLWRNYQGLSALNVDIIPSRFTSGTGSYTSGTLNLDKLKTLVDIVYSPYFSDKDDGKVQQSFQTYISANMVPSGTEMAGPFNKFLKGVSLGAYDINNQIDGLARLTSIDDCPADLLPFLASQIGWTLYGTDETSWRNQLRNAARLYQQKGTKQSIIDALNTILVENPLNTSATLVEFYESYLPNLVYYLLKTSSDLFDSMETYTPEKAAELGVDTYSPTDIDFNLRAAVDYIMKILVTFVPENFYVRNEPFRVNLLEDGTAWFGPVIQAGDGNYYTGTVFDRETSKYVAVKGDPKFTFNYRGRDYPIPPWDDRKFYRNCVITQKLLNVLRQTLTGFCTSEQDVDTSLDYINQYTLSATAGNDLYVDNQFLFYTSSQQLPPNYDTILKAYDSDNYDYLSLWNGKSSLFDFTVGAGDFSSVMFGDASSRYTVNEIVDSLNIIPEFSPAKAIPRVRLSRDKIESSTGVDFACKSIRFDPDASTPYAHSLHSRGLSGAIHGYEICGVWTRGTAADNALGHAVGQNHYPGFDDAKSTVTHAGVPVFVRDQANFALNVASSVVNGRSTVPTASGIPRRSIRRRDFKNTLEKQGWYGRDGRNMPSFYNNTSSLLDFSLLGYIPSSYSFASMSAETLSGTFIQSCESSGSTSVRNEFGIDVTGAFPVRSTSGNAGRPSVSSCDQHVRRDLTNEEILLFHQIHEKKKKAIAENFASMHGPLLTASASWANTVEGITNSIVDEGFDKYYSPKLDIRHLNGPSQAKGIQYVYNKYNEFFRESYNFSGLPENSKNLYANGGANILSHTFGSIIYNSNFSKDGSAINTSGQLISTAAENPYRINLASSGIANLSAIGLTDSTANTNLLFGYPEYRIKTILSSMDFIDPSTSLLPQNEFIVFGLDEKQRSYILSNYLINNRIIVMKNKSQGLPRIRFGLRSAAEKNILIPEHDFELKVKYATGKENSRTIGGHRIGVVIHTKSEATTDGRNVMFAWTPNNKWEMVDLANMNLGTQSVELILNNLAHTFSDEDSVLDVGAGCGDDRVRVVRSMSEDNFSTATIKFHTKNALDRLPLEYTSTYNAGNSTIYNGSMVQLHRASIGTANQSQNYFVSIFSYPSLTEDNFSVIDTIDLKDLTLNEAAQYPYEAMVPDLRKQFDPVSRPVFYKSDGTKIRPPAPDRSANGIINKLSLAATTNTFLGVRFLGNVLPTTMGQPTRYPYVGLTNESWTQSYYGWDYALLNGPGEALGFNTMNISYWNNDMRRYFRERALYNEALNPFKAGLFSVERWSDVLFHGRIDHPFRPADTGRYGLLHPTKFPLTLDYRTVINDFSKQIPNPLGYTGLQDTLTTNVYSYFPVGAVTDLVFWSLRFNPSYTGDGVWQEDRFKSIIQDPLGKLDYSVVKENYQIPNTHPQFQMDEGRTFSPMSTYQDVTREKLIHDKKYTFSTYVSYPSGVTGFGSLADDRATSAILTIAPIGSQTSYTRVTFNFGVEGTTNASAIETNGHTLTGADAAQVHKVIQNTSNGAGYPHDAVWYRLQVTLPYDSTELDLSGEANLGLRCSLHAYNDAYDNNVPADWASQTQRKYIAAHIHAWGPALHQSESPKEWERYTDVLPLADGITLVDAVLYKSEGNIIYEFDNNLVQDALGKLYQYDSKTSSLDPLTVAVDAPNNTEYASWLYSHPTLIDTSGYTFNSANNAMSLKLDKTNVLIRSKLYDTDYATKDLELTVSAGGLGTNMKTRVAGTLPFTPTEILHLFRYFNKVGQVSWGKGVNTRVEADASGLHASGGGSRLNYRIHGASGATSKFGNFSGLDITN